MRQPKSEITRTRGAGIFAHLGLEFAFEEWMLFASCYGLDPTPWYPEKGGDTAVARKICNRCYVKDECLRYAVENREEHGVWGGTTTRQRRKLIQEIHGDAPESHSVKQKFKCGGCNLVTSPSSLGMHQKYTGHEGRDDVAQPPA